MCLIRARNYRWTPSLRGSGREEVAAACRAADGCGSGCAAAAAKGKDGGPGGKNILMWCSIPLGRRLLPFPRVTANPVGRESHSLVLALNVTSGEGDNEKKEDADGAPFAEGAGVRLQRPDDDACMVWSSTRQAREDCEAVARGGRTSVLLLSSLPTST